MAAVVVGTGDQRAFEYVGNFEGDLKWYGCVELPDGRIVFSHSEAV